MELNAYSDGCRQSANIPRKMDDIMMARCLSTVGEPRSEIPHAPHLFQVEINHTPSAATQQGGRVGLSSVPHGKLVAYKSYI